MKPKAKGFLIAGVVITSVFVSQLVADMTMTYKGNKNIWWTHREKMLTLDQAQKQCEVYLFKELLSCYIDHEALYVQDQQGNYHNIEFKDVGIRLNHWLKQKTALLQKMVLSAFFSGIGVCLLLTGLYLQFQKINKDNV